jgi:hypothetical protein
MKWEKLTTWEADGYVIRKLGDGNWFAGFATSFGGGGIGTFKTLPAAKKACAEHKAAADHIQAHLDVMMPRYNPFPPFGWKK